MTKQLSLAMYARLSRGKGKGKGVGANHPIKYKQDAARRGRVEGLLRAPPYDPYIWPRSTAKISFISISTAYQP